MKYFLLETDTKNNLVPRIKNWYSKIDRRYINKEVSYKLPDWMLLDIESNRNTIFPDVISFPFFMFSEKFKNVIELYDSKMEYKKLVLFDKENVLYQLYFLPILDEIDCMVKKIDNSKSESMIDNGVLLRDKVSDEVFFRIKNKYKFYVVVRLDVVESLIRRNPIGLKLKEIPAVAEMHR